MISITIVHDSELTARGLRDVLAESTEYHVKRLVCSREELSMLLKDESERADGYLLGAGTEGGWLDAPKLIPRLTERRPDAWFVAMFQQRNRTRLREACARGAAGVLWCDTSSHRIIDAIRCVHDGGFYVCPMLCTSINNLLSEGPRQTTTAEALGVTDRQLEVLTLLGEGCCRADLADALGIEPATVTSHCKALRRRLGLQSIAELRVFSWTHGLACPDNIRPERSKQSL